MTENYNKSEIPKIEDPEANNEEANVAFERIKNLLGLEENLLLTWDIDPSQEPENYGKILTEITKLPYLPDLITAGMSLEEYRKVVEEQQAKDE